MYWFTETYTGWLQTRVLQYRTQNKKLSLLVWTIIEYEISPRLFRVNSCYLGLIMIVSFILHTHYPSPKTNNSSSYLL